MANSCWFSKWRLSIIKSQSLLLGWSMFVLVVLISGLIGSHFVRQPFLAFKKMLPVWIQDKGVLPIAGYYNDSKTHLYLYGGESSHGYGGVIALASSDEPVVNISSYNLTGQLDIDLYKADETALLNYLVHDEEGNQAQDQPDTTQFEHVVTFSHALESSSEKSSTTTSVPLPISEGGIWYLKVRSGSVGVGSYIIRSKTGVFVSEGDGELIVWGQDLRTKRSIIDGEVKVFNLLNGIKQEQTSFFNNEGIAKTNLSVNADIALIKTQDDLALVPLNLHYINTGYFYQKFKPRSAVTRRFIFVDRPLYRPGDTIYFKSILRDDDDARYSVPSGQVVVEIFDGYSSPYSSSRVPIFSQRYPISADGTISGQYQLPQTARPNQYYTLTVKPANQEEQANFYNPIWVSDSVNFGVEYYRKPEFFLDVTPASSEFIAGDSAPFRITGQYFSGHPLAHQQVKYRVHMADMYEYEYESEVSSLLSSVANDYRYGHWSSRNVVDEGVVALDEKGEATVGLNTNTEFDNGKTQVFSIEVTLDDGSLAPAFVRKNLLVHAGEYGIYRQGDSYSIQRANSKVSLPMVLLPNKANVNVQDVKLEAQLQRMSWVKYQEEGHKYPSYRSEEEDLGVVSAQSNSQGQATFEFTPTVSGQYTLTVEGSDTRGNLISKKFYVYVYKEDEPDYLSINNGGLSIRVDKTKYQPAETAKLSVYSVIPDRDVFLSMERGRVDRFQVLHLKGTTAEVDLPLKNTDLPNVFAEVVSFSDNDLDTATANVEVSTKEKELKITIQPDSQVYGPGEMTKINIRTTDATGNPVSAELALWAVDKAIFELADNQLGDIFSTFWQTRANTTPDAHSLEGIFVNAAEGGGCFAHGTQILMANGNTKPIEQVAIGEKVLARSPNSSRLVKAKVLDAHSAWVSGYLIINGHLKVTANHIVWANESWQEAGSLKIGDQLINSDGQLLSVDSLEWVRGQFLVYNLKIERYHTFFANGVWVHNDKGDVRSVFKDTAYWNPNIQTDQSGQATVSFVLPDNLTTWTVAAVGSTPDTKVGQSTQEITVQKDVIVRPLLPNILRVDDEVVLTALVQNFTEDAHTFDLNLSFNAGEIKTSKSKRLTLNSNEIKKVSWQIHPTQVNEQAQVVFTLKATDDDQLIDEVTQLIPVRQFGFEEQTVETGMGSKDYQLQLKPNSDRSLSSVELSLSSTMLGSLQTAMTYLINYPYGCVEQTTSSFVPAVIAKSNPALFTEALGKADVDEIIQKSIAKLTMQQNEDGGWTWWFSGDSNPYLSTYVTEYLLEARKLGFEVSDSVLDSAKYYFQSMRVQDLGEDQSDSCISDVVFIKNYGLALFGEKGDIQELKDSCPLNSDILALAVISNYRNGDTNPNSNGLNRLVAQAQSQGDALFWPEGSKDNFGSKDASTALAIRAIVLTGGDMQVAAKGAQYLVRNRHFNYWSSTYATAQVVWSLVELFNFNREDSDSFSYSVYLDDQLLSQGVVTPTDQLMKKMEIPVEKIKADGSTLSVELNGDGQLYSTLVMKEFNTNRQASAYDHGLSVSKTIVNDKGDNYPLAVGEIALVRITLSGLEAEERYGLIHDELPSGLVPINQSFKNEQYENEYNSGYGSHSFGGEITENGVIISLHQVSAGQKEYTYKARVVSEGVYAVPPVTASLMYAPEIYGRSEVQEIVIKTESDLIPVVGTVQIPESVWRFLCHPLVGVGVLTTALGGLSVLVLKKRGVSWSRLVELINRKKMSE